MALEPFYKEDTIEAGCDEAGRGCLAGPVVAAAVILAADFSHPLLNDSKKMTEKARLIVRQSVIENAVAWGVGMCSHEEIDELNILRASFLAMHRALDSLKIRPGFILVDGNRFVKYKSTPHVCVIKGDGRYASIAAASVIAKTERDSIMEKLHEEYPVYGWNNNKGYPTEVHRKALCDYGETPYHRKTFRMDFSQLSLPL